MMAYDDFLEQCFDGSTNHSNPLIQAYAASKCNNEVFNLSEMLRQPDKAAFIVAMEAEVQSMFDQGIWRTVPKKEMLRHYQKLRDKGQDVKRHQIMMVWSFKRKRHPDGTLKKHKARLCCHGGQQQFGVNYWDTYAPVVSWSSIRIIMTIAKLHNLHTKSVDFVQAYPQAPIRSTIFLRTPPGVELTHQNGEVVLKLIRNLYGLKDAGRTWHQHLTDGLRALGFTPTESDPCVYHRDRNLIVLYVDDCVIVAQNKAEGDAIYRELEQTGFSMTDEGSLEEYLGLQIEHGENGKFRVSQPMLITRIVEAIPSMKDALSSKTPASPGIILTKDIGGEPRKESWNYRSVVGMMNFLVTCSHPELAFAVHQVARFSNNPTHQHEQAIKRIVRYLIGTQRGRNKTEITRGILYQPGKTKSIEAFVDASFAGEWNAEWSDEPSSVMSRTGYVVLYANCPVIWSSKLQSEIALSTTEAEYIAFSQCLRDVIPLIELLKELRRTILFDDQTPLLHCTVQEDNRGCIDLVETPRMRPRTKHIALKYHHFRNYVCDKTVSVKYVESKEQIADIFTKALGDCQFCYLRKLLMGW